MAAENFKVKKGLEVGTGSTITSGGINITGVVTATTFVGDGSGLTGVTGSGSGVVIKHDGSAIGTASTINFSTNLDVSAISAGIVTITALDTGISSVAADTTPQLGGNLDLDGKFINGTGGANITGVVTATTFVGALTGAASTSNTVSVSDESSSTACFPLFVTASVAGGLVQAGNLAPKAGSNLSFDSVNGRLQTTKFTGVSLIATGDILQISASGISTFTGNIDANGNLDVDGQTDLDDVVIAGVSTFNDGITLGTNSTTFAAKFADDAIANFGTDNDLKIYHDDGNGLTYIRQDGTGPLDIRSINDIDIRDGNDGDLFIKCEESEGVKLYYEGNEKLEVTNHGAIVTGVCTATSFSGSAAGLTNIPSAQLSGALPSLDGSALTGVTASGSGVVVKHDGSTVGTAGTINFSTNLDVTAVSAGIVTITASGGSGITTENVVTDSLVVSGISTFQNNITASGTSRFEIASMENGVLDGEISHNGDATTKIKFETSTIKLDTAGTTRLNVNNSGVIVTGVATATSFSGSGASLTALNASNLGSGTIPNGRFPATLPATSGVNLTALNASEITSGTLPIARIDDAAVTFAKMQHVGTGVFIGRDSSGTGDIETMTAAEARTLLNVADGATAGITTFQNAAWTVSNNSSSNYVISGPGGLSGANNPDLHLVRGQTYQFIMNASGHGFGI